MSAKSKLESLPDLPKGYWWDYEGGWVWLIKGRLLQWRVVQGLPADQDSIERIAATIYHNEFEKP